MGRVFLPPMIQPVLKTAKPLRALFAFLRGESLGGATLIAASAAALVWSNSAASPAYFRLLSARVGLSVQDWVNEALMTLFFLTVSLEIRREMTSGQLASPRRAAAPVLAAIGGMAVPALIFAALNWHSPDRLRGWAVPVATDIAFALAALRLAGRHAPAGLKVFLTALAIIDDLGAIVIIAIFYGGRLQPAAAMCAAAILAGLWALRRVGLRAFPAYLAGGVALWIAVKLSGLHPTLAGVGLALVLPMDGTQACPAMRLETALNPVLAWLVLPLFGLANAGLDLHGMSFHSFAAPVAASTMAALLAGKAIGVFGTTAASVRMGLARMPRGLTWSALAGGAVLCGVGFTMSLFIADLAYRGTKLHAEAKLGIFTASLAAALLGLVILRLRPAK